MTYEKAKEIAKSARSYEDVDNFLKQIELDENITDKQYYNLIIKSKNCFRIYGIR